MTGTGASSRDSLRLFLALRLPLSTVDRISAWQAEALSGGRLVAREHLHVTLAFLGRRPAVELVAIAAELRGAAAAAHGPLLTVRSYRETRSVGMLVFQDDGKRATALATDVHHRLERLGVYRPERRPWLPHVTVLRFRERPRLRPDLPDLGEVSLSEAAVYHSLLRPTGAQYEVLEAVALGG
jgi:RNA 2',3'-cyclic 3'-phosphodiesterase